MPLHTEDEDFDHVVIGHGDYYIEGETTWYGGSKSERLEVKTLKSFNGVSFIFSGHIHLPSKDILFTNLPNGEQVGVFYMGSVTRVAFVLGIHKLFVFVVDVFIRSQVNQIRIIR